MLITLLLLILPSHQIVIEKQPVIIQADVTRYSEKDSCHYVDCLTAAGIPPTEQTIACPRKYPLYTSVRINGKDYICHDRTALRYDGRWDIWTGYGEGSYQEAIKFGKKSLAIQIIK